jgi:hypothetical protein
VDDLLHELDHGIKEDVSLPQALETGRSFGAVDHSSGSLTGLTVVT